MTSSQSITPMTGDKFRRWAATHAPALELKQEQRRREVEDTVASILHHAMRNRSLPLNDAGDDILTRFPYGGAVRSNWTPTELKAALVSLGWQPKRLRGKGGDA